MVFILCPYDRSDRINVVRWGICNEKPIYVLEAGFISSIYPLGNKESPISFHVDSTGSLYLDGDGNNEVVNFLNSEEELSDKEEIELENLRKSIIENGISKYNFSKNIKGAGEKSKILIIDQTRNDFSIQMAGANEQTFDNMMDMAIANHPFDSISIKVHPEVLLGIRDGNINIDKYRNKDNVIILSDNLSPKDLFDGVEHVYTVSSTLGFEALLYGKTVHLFGKSFFGGWGLTIDYVEYKNRKRSRKIYDLMYAIYVNSTFYKNVNTNKPCNVFTAIENFILLVNNYRTEGNYAEYQTKNLKKQIEVLDKELRILQGKFKNLEKTQLNLSTINSHEKAGDKKTKQDIGISSILTTQNVNQNKKELTEEKKHYPKIELSFMKFIVRDKRKLNKYLRDREMFFKDSSSFALRKYWDFFGKKN